MDAKRLRREIERLLDSQTDNKRLRDNLEGLCRDPLFPGLTWFWGPALYARSKPIFRPFILSHFSNWITDGGRRWSRITWDTHAERLETWLAAARAGRDVVLVRRLLRWKYANPRGWDSDPERWNAALLAAYSSAPTPAARAIVLDEFDDWFQLDEPTAIGLYRTDRAASAFILRHLPQFFWRTEKRAMWAGLGTLARTIGDDEFFFALYRALMPVERWSAEATALADAIAEPAELNRALEQRHIDGYGLKRGATLIKLLEQRGRDVLPYVRANLESTIGGWFGEGPEPFIALAETKGWWDLWAASVRGGSNDKPFNAAVGKLMTDRAMHDSLRRERLKALAGVSREWNWPGFGLARVHGLDDHLACLVYRRYPELVHGPLRANVTPTWWRGYPKLIEAAQSAGDDDLVDILASRYATRVSWAKLYGRGKTKKDEDDATASKLADYYQAIRDRDRNLFAQRASNLLTRIPAYATFRQNDLLRTNDLARLLFVRSFDAYLAVAGAVRDLVEGSNIHVQMLAYRVLALDDARARTLAAESIDILLGTLLRPLHRKTRLPAFDALANAARGSETAAARILVRAREALRLPDKKYPKQELIGLIAKVLAARPALAAERERPIVFRHHGVSA